MAQLMSVYLRLHGLLRWLPSTYQSNCGLIQHYILPCMGDMRLSELSPRMVAALYSQMLEEPRAFSPYHKQGGQKLSPTTLRSIHKVLHSAFERVILWEYVDRDPFYRAPLPAYRQKQEIFLTPEQSKQLVLHGSPILALVIHLTFAASLRKRELLALTWQDIDFSRNNLRVDKIMARISRNAVNQVNQWELLHRFPPVGKRQRTVLVLKQPETEVSVRTVYLPPSLMAQMKQSRPASWETGGLPSSHLIFAYPASRPMQECTLTKQFQLALKQAGLPKATFHGLR